jgi:hypothetical protein
VPEEAIMSDTREPSYMFLAAEWNRSSVSERAYLLAMLFGREFEVEANDLSLRRSDEFLESKKKGVKTPEKGRNAGEKLIPQGQAARAGAPAERPRSRATARR